MTAKEDEAILKRYSEMLQTYEVEVLDTRTLKRVRIPKQWIIDMEKKDAKPDEKS